MQERIRFYGRWSAFQFQERFTDLGGTVAFLLLYPFFIWLLVQMWGRFNSSQMNYTREEMAIYVSITELLFLTFLRSSFLQRSQADFSIGLSRPRSWVAMTFVGQFGSSFGGRILYAILALIFVPLLGVPITQILEAFYRLLFLLPILGVIEALLSTLLATAQIRWHETRYFVLPTTKIFLALGGVFGALADYGEPGRSLFLRLLPSDLFFQPAHFCVKGSFYQLSLGEWLGRLGLWTVTLSIGGYFFYRSSRRVHQSFGG
jgi:hypothetical protein